MRDTMRGVAVVVALGASLCAAWGSWQKARPESAPPRGAQQAMLGRLDPGDFKGFHNPIPYTEALRLEDHLVKGKTVVFEFGAAYCGMCREYAPRMTRLDERRADIVVKTVEIDPQIVHSSAANSPAQRFGIIGIPAFRVYGPDGKLQLQGIQALARVQQLLKQVGA
ncbi:MAG: thioredoxin family protein [Armatimonadetes bacterium]|nr:thioredoxin family protein [Armatimonadota bacterium]